MKELRVCLLLSALTLAFGCRQGVSPVPGFGIPKTLERIWSNSLYAFDRDPDFIAGRDSCAFFGFSRPTPDKPLCLGGLFEEGGMLYVDKGYTDKLRVSDAMYFHTLGDRIFFFDPANSVMVCEEDFFDKTPALMQAKITWTPVDLSVIVENKEQIRGLYVAGSGNYLILTEEEGENAMILTEGSRGISDRLPLGTSGETTAVAMRSDGGGIVVLSGDKGSVNAFQFVDGQIRLCFSLEAGPAAKAVYADAAHVYVLCHEQSEEKIRSLICVYDWTGNPQHLYRLQEESLAIYVERREILWTLSSFTVNNHQKVMLARQYNLNAN